MIRLLSGSRPNSASTPKRCSSNSGTPGTTSPSFGSQGRSREAHLPIYRCAVASEYDAEQREVRIGQMGTDTPKSGDLRGRLLDAARQVFGSSGYASATVDDIITSAGT